MLFNRDASFVGIDTSSKPIRFVIGCLVFMLTLMLLGAVAFQKYIEMGDSQLKQSVIFDVNGEGQDPEVFDQTSRALRQNLSATAGVVGTEYVVDQAAPRHLLLTASLASQMVLTHEDLLSNLRQIYPHVTLQSQLLATSITDPIYRALLLITFALMGLVGVTMMLSITLVTRTGLNMQRSVIDILRLIGAPNPFIARQFQWFAFRMSFVSSFLGVTFAFSCFFIFTLLSKKLGIPENATVLHQELVIIMAALPFVIALLALVVARVEVVRTLIRLDRQYT